MFAILYIFRRPYLLLILNKQITTDCFVLIYNPLVCLSHVESVQGPVVQSVVSLTSMLRVISLTVLADSIYNILIFFAEKM